MDEFIIPVSSDELLANTGSNQYRVTKLIEFSTLATHIKVFEDTLRDRRSGNFYKMFDYLYSVLHYWSKVDVKLRDRTWDAVLESCRRWPAMVAGLGANLEDLSVERQFDYRNSIKMSVYLLCRLVELVEGQMQQARELQTTTPKGSRRGGTKKHHEPMRTGVTNNDWLSEVNDAVGAICQLVTKCSLEKLWNPPLLEEDFVNLVGNCCYKLLENADFCKNQKIRSTVIDVLTKFNKFHNHTNSCSVKLVQLLQCHSHFGTFLLQICTKFIEANLHTTVREILREICVYSSKDLETNSQASSAFANFLVEFGSQNPHEVVPMLPELCNKLDEEPFAMRNCVLTIIGEVIMKVYPEDPTNRDQLLDTIEEHLMETNGFVRSKAMAVLLSIVEKGTIMPLKRKTRLMEILVGETGALFDTSSNVRKQSMRIMTCFIEQNIAKGLTDKDILEHIGNEKEDLKVLEEKFDEIKDTQDTEFIKQQLTRIEVSDNSEVQNSHHSSTEPPKSVEGVRMDLQRQMEVKQAALVLLEDSLCYVQLLCQAVLDVRSMLNSHIASDVVDAVRFFRHAHLHSGGALPCVTEAVRQMLLLVGSKDDTVRNAVAEAYRDIYLVSYEQPDETESASSRVARQLCRLVNGATNAELTALEMLIVHFSKNGDIDCGVVKSLWTTFIQDDLQQKRPSPLAAEMRAAVTIFSMAATIYKPFMWQYYEHFTKENIPYSWFQAKDLMFIGGLCRAIINIVQSKPNEDKLAEPLRLPRDHFLFRKLIDLCLETFNNTNRPNWFTMSQEVMNLVYLLSESPDQHGAWMLHQMARKTFKSDPLQPAATPGQSQTSWFSCVDQLSLARFLWCGGQLAVCHFTHLEVHVLNELKRRSTIRDKNRQQQKQTYRDRNNAGNDQSSEEMGLVGPSADDAEADSVRKVCEEELVSQPDRLLYHVLRLTLAVCDLPASAGVCPRLANHVGMALSKLLVLSQVATHQHVDQLLRLAVRAPAAVTRANLMVALGDLVRRFPNELEPFTHILYARLRDRAPSVRKAALSIISHLVLNDMIKVKGQMSEMTTCLVDPDEPGIVHLARVFFQELSSKDQALYNIMPDIISRLSCPDTGVSPQDFKTIMEFLMPFISKKNQAEKLFDKFCMRLHSSHEERSWKDLALCLSLLTYNENMLRSLIHNVSLFAGKLHVPEVYDALVKVLSCKQSGSVASQVAAGQGGVGKTEVGQDAIDEALARLRQLRDVGVEDEEAQLNAQHAATKAHKRRTTTRPRSSKAMTQPTPRRNIHHTAVKPTNAPVPAADISSDSDLFSASEDEEPTPATAPSNASIRSVRSTQKRMRVIDDSESDSE